MSKRIFTITLLAIFLICALPALAFAGSNPYMTKNGTAISSIKTSTALEFTSQNSESSSNETLSLYLGTQKKDFSAVYSANAATNENDSSKSNTANEASLTSRALANNVLSVYGTTELGPTNQNTGHFCIVVKTVPGLKTVAQTNIAFDYDNGTGLFTFYGSLNLDDVADGKYIVTIGRTFGTVTSLIYHNAIIRIENGDAAFVRYTNIESANAAAYKKMAAYNNAPSWTDKTMEEMGLIMRTKAGGSTDSLTTTQITYLTKLAKNITAGCTTNYEKARAIFEYVSAHVYYDEKNPTGSGAITNPYTLLSSAANGGKPATNCVGYATCTTALARMLGIPSRVVYGRHIENKLWEDITDINTSNHHWSEFYIDGRWVVVDSLTGANKKLKNGVTYTNSNIPVASYTFFDPSPEQEAQNLVVMGTYKTYANKTTITAPTVKLTNDAKTGKVVISWGKVKGASKYKVYRCTQKYGYYTLLKTTTALSYTDTGVSPGKAYYYRVRAVSSYSTRADSESAPLSRMVKLHQAWSFKVTLYTKTKAVLTWSKQSSATYTYIYRATSKYGTYKKIATTKATKYVDSRRYSGKKYYYKLVLVYKGVPSANSATSAIVAR